MNILITRENNLKLLFKIYYLIILLITLCVLTSLIFVNTFYQKVNTAQNTAINTAAKNLLDFHIDDLHNASSLQKNELINNIQIDEVRQTKIIPHIEIAQLPRDLKTVRPIKNRKDLFLKITLPLIVQENKKLLSINKKINSIKDRFGQISRKEAVFISNLMEEYKEDYIDNLIIKVDEIPVSLALSQAVIESGWGTSRFAYEGNALFGQYVWGNTKNGIVPNEREINAKHKIKSFNTLRESVASYMKNLNTNFHYNEFRINRFVLRSNKQPLSGSYLADYLFNYSIEQDYPNKIKTLIEINNFEDFENLSIGSYHLQDTDII